MPARRLPAGSVASACAIALAACASHVSPRVEPRPPALTATREDLLEQLELLSAGIQDFGMDGEMGFEDRESGRRNRVGVKLAARKPGELRIQGTKSLLPTLFTIVASDGEVWLDVPSRRRTYWRPRGRQAAAPTGMARALAAFDPASLLEALVPDPPRPDEERYLLEEHPDAYVLAAVACGADGDRPARRLTFDRVRLALVESQVFDGNGRALRRATYRRPDALAPLPAGARIEWPFAGITIEIENRRGRLGAAGTRAFDFTLPPGRELVDVTAAGAIPDALPDGDERAP